MLSTRFLLILSELLACSAAWAVEPPPRASFDCAKAKLPIEHRICEDAKLARLDRELAVLFKKALRNTAATKNDVLASQRAWLSGRAHVCPVESHAARACLTRLYEERAAALRRASDAQSSVAICDAAAAIVRQGGDLNEPWPRMSGEAGEPPFVSGAVTPFSKQALADLRRHWAGDSTYEQAFAHGDSIDFGVPTDLVAIKSVSLGTLQCDELDLFRRLAAHRYDEVGNPMDHHPAPGFGCSSFDVGHDDARRPVVLSSTGNAGETVWQFTSWLGTRWDKSCRVHASYKVQLRRTSANCAHDVNCDLLTQDALTWAVSWDALGFEHPEPKAFAAVAETATPEALRNASRLPDLGKDGVGAFGQYEFGTPTYAGPSSAGPVDLKISYPHYGDRAEDAIIVGVYRKNGEAIGAFEFSRASIGKPVHVVVEK